MMIRIGAALLAAAALSMPATAQTQTQMTTDAGSALERADAAMTRQWTVTYAAMKRQDAGDDSPDGKFGYAAATLASQRAWLKFRDAQCVIESGEFAGGSMQGMANLQCQTRLTNDRTIQLRKLEWVRE